MFQLAAIVFIASVGGGALYLANRPTVATRDGLAAQLREIQDLGPEIQIACSDNVPIEMTTTWFHCELQDRDGSVDQLACGISRDGIVSCKTESSHRVHAQHGGDPWK